MEVGVAPESCTLPANGGSGKAVPKSEVLRQRPLPKGGATAAVGAASRGGALFAKRGETAGSGRSGSKGGGSKGSGSKGSIGALGGGGGGLRAGRALAEARAADTRAAEIGAEERREEAEAWGAYLAARGWEEPEHSRRLYEPAELVEGGALFSGRSPRCRIARVSTNLPLPIRRSSGREKFRSGGVAIRRRLPLCAHGCPRYLRAFCRLHAPGRASELRTPSADFARPGGWRERSTPAV